MRICFDLDNTLCKGYPYQTATPIEGARELLSTLKNEGHTIIIQTARGMGSHSGNVGKAQASIGELTFKQLREWNFPYDEIYFGKPEADLFVDDKALHIVDYDQVLDQIHSLELDWYRVSQKVINLENHMFSR